MKTLDDFKEDALLLLEAGFIAINQADFDSANMLFKAAEILDANVAMCEIGKGYACLHQLKISEAKKWFKKILDRDPNHQMAKTFWGWTEMMDPNHMNEGRKTCENILKETHDSDIKQFASSAIKFAEEQSKDHKHNVSSPLHLHHKTQKRPQ